MTHRFLSHAARFFALAWICAALVVCMASAQKKVPPSSPLDLNTATAAQLQQVPGIGPSAAKSIVNMREKSGRFHRVEDLLAIHGISQSRLDKIRPYVFVSPPK
jgi:competence ComEA-like helix-hairpin-helix protein